MRHLKIVYRRLRHGFRERTIPKPKRAAVAASFVLRISVSKCAINILDFKNIKKKRKRGNSVYLHFAQRRLFWRI